jgi:hypothetical protein
MTSAIFAVTLALGQDNYKPHRFDPTGMVLTLPVEPKQEKTVDQLTLSAEYKSVKVRVLAAQRTVEAAQPVSEAYTQKFGEFRQKYGKKIKSILNENPVVEAFQFGAVESIGFVIEVDDAGGKVFAWQRVLLDGWEYDVSVESSRRDQPVMEKILGAIRYVDPGTGDFRVSALGATGMQSYLGIAFLPQESIARDEAKSVVLQSELFPATILATIWDNETIDYENEDQLKKAMSKWLAGFVQGAASDFDFKSMKTEMGTTFDFTGEATVQGVGFKLIGRSYSQRDEARVMIAVIDPRDTKAEPFARKVLDSLSLISR